MSWRAASGLRPWLLQRLSAVYLAAYLLFSVVVWVGGVADFHHWQAWFAQPLVNAASLLFLVALLGHAWVGTRDILMDYVKPVGWRFALLSLFGLAFLISLGLGLRGLLQVGA